MCINCDAPPGTAFDWSAYSEHMDRLLRMARNIDSQFRLPDDATPDDLAQEVYRKLADHNGEPIRTSVEGLALRVMAWTGRDWYVRRQGITGRPRKQTEKEPKTEPPQPETRAPYEEQVLDGIAADKIRAALAKRLGLEAYPNTWRELYDVVDVIAGSPKEQLTKADGAAIFEAMLADLVGDHPVRGTLLAAFIEAVWDRPPQRLETQDKTMETYRRTVSRGRAKLRQWLREEIDSCLQETIQANRATHWTRERKKPSFSRSD